MMRAIVVGSGVVGLGGAFLLALEGYRVRVITRNPEEATSWVAGGMLAPFSEGLVGSMFDFSYESLKEYPSFVKRLEEVSGQKVDYWQEGIFRLALKGEEDVISKAKEYKSLGYKVEFVEPSSLGWLSEEVGGVVYYEEEGWVDTESLMDALLFACERLGVEITIDEVVRVHKKDSRVESLQGLKESYRADLYLFCTGAWTKELFDLPVFPVKGQALKVKGVPLQRVHYSSASYLIPRSRYLYIGATSEVNTFYDRNTLEGLYRLSYGAIKVVPSLSRAEFLSAVVGFRPATPDELPIFELGENYLLATGHYRNGILHAPLTARLMLEWAKEGKKSPYFESFSSKRFFE
ncbi:MAG: glycine oxidase ThiO [Aquificota bacterium]|nr:MAG: glycine oxidase ThiO [Aquificota bacterium]